VIKAMFQGKNGPGEVSIIDLCAFTNTTSRQRMDLVLAPGLNLIQGPMRSGKSHELSRLCGVFVGSTQHVVHAFTPTADTRPEQTIRKDGSTIVPNGRAGLITSRCGTEVKATRVRNIDDIIPSIIAAGAFNETTIIVLDEAHFLPDLDKLVDEIERYSNIYLVLCCLGSRFDRAPWPNVAAIENRAATKRFLLARCQTCSKPASFNFLSRKYRSRLSEEGFLVGDAEFSTLCGPCWKRADELDTM
jgi:thymidine kinase